MQYWSTTFAYGYLILFGSILAFSAYVFLLDASAPECIATHAYVNPVVAVALDRLLLARPSPGPCCLPPTRQRLSGGSARIDGAHARFTYATHLIHGNCARPTFQGSGEMRVIIDAPGRAATQAFAALAYRGQTQPEATHWWIFHAMSSTDPTPPRGGHGDSAKTSS